MLQGSTYPAKTPFFAFFRDFNDFRLHKISVREAHLSNWYYLLCYCIENTNSYFSEPRLNRGRNLTTRGMNAHSVYFSYLSTQSHYNLYLYFLSSYNKVDKYKRYFIVFSFIAYQSPTRELTPFGKLSRKIAQFL